jgi:hypothetical protein
MSTKTIIACTPGEQRQTRALARPALVCAAVAFALTACTTLGTGTGSAHPDADPVSFSWKSTDGGITGTMSATLVGGRTFLGPFLEITRDVRSQDFDPLWSGWPAGWPDWAGLPAWEIGNAFPAIGFTTQYSGRVMANLQAPDGERMRCRFQLNKPIDGMTGGGQGECQLANGRSVDAVFPPA